MDFNKIFAPMWFMFALIGVFFGVLHDNNNLITLGMLCYIASLIHGMKETLE